ncbi:MAG: hypothetical protein K9K82_07725 [Desulfobacteraceae bacterium]|nr:hypothetical protein [Desulfobacteraceae bacterium]
MDPAIPETIKSVCINVDPGICGFSCRIIARKNGRKTVRVEIGSCDCQQIQKLSGLLTELALKDLFLPVTRNPVYIAAEKSGCHPTCGIPVAILKTVEVAMGMAVPKDVEIRFQRSSEQLCSAAHPYVSNEGKAHEEE